MTRRVLKQSKERSDCDEPISSENVSSQIDQANAALASKGPGRLVNSKEGTNCCLGQVTPAEVRTLSKSSDFGTKPNSSMDDVEKSDVEIAKRGRSQSSSDNDEPTSSDNASGKIGNAQDRVEVVSKGPGRPRKTKDISDICTSGDPVVLHVSIPNADSVDASTHTHTVMDSLCKPNQSDYSSEAPSESNILDDKKKQGRKLSVTTIPNKVIGKVLTDIEKKRRGRSRTHVSVTKSHTPAVVKKLMEKKLLGNCRPRVVPKSITFNKPKIIQKSQAMKSGVDAHTQARSNMSATVASASISAVAKESNHQMSGEENRSILANAQQVSQCTAKQLNPLVTPSTTDPIKSEFGVGKATQRMISNSAVSSKHKRDSMQAMGKGKILTKFSSSLYVDEKRRYRKLKKQRERMIWRSTPKKHAEDLVHLKSIETTSPEQPVEEIKAEIRRLQMLHFDFLAAKVGKCVDPGEEGYIVDEDVEGPTDLHPARVVVAKDYVGSISYQVDDSEEVSSYSSAVGSNEDPNCRTGGRSHGKRAPDDPDGASPKVRKLDASLSPKIQVSMHIRRKRIARIMEKSRQISIPCPQAPTNKRIRALQRHRGAPRISPNDQLQSKSQPKLERLSEKHSIKTKRLTKFEKLTQNPKTRSVQAVDMKSTDWKEQFIQALETDQAVLIPDVFSEELCDNLLHGDNSTGRRAWGGIKSLWARATKSSSCPISTMRRSSRYFHQSENGFINRGIGRQDFRIRDPFPVDLQTCIEPLQDAVHSLMARRGVPNLSNFRRRTHNIMIVQPEAECQEWHVDFGGSLPNYFTILIGLHNGPQAMGGTQCAFPDGRSIAHPVRGQALVFDGRLFHRGLSNQTREDRYFYYAALSTTHDANTGNAM